MKEAKQIKVPRINYFRDVLNDFFYVKLQGYLDSLEQSESAMAVRLESHIAIEDVIAIRPEVERFIFTSIGNYGRQNEFGRAFGNLRDSVIHADVSMSLFFVGKNSHSVSACEDNSYSIYEDFLTFLQKEGLVFRLENEKFTSSLHWEYSDNLQVKGLETISGGKLPLNLFTCYIANITPKISIYVK